MLARIPQRDPLDIQTQKSLATIKRWASECDTEHRGLCVSNTEFKMPSRLLDVGSEHVIRLVEMLDPEDVANLSNRVQYVALSHCWGSESTLTTISSNRQELMSGFSATRLSQTFRDAISVTRHLGLRHVWIDSLCIIQDNHQDWERESAKMGSVYQNAFLTIAATRSASGRGGCFSAVSDTPYIWQEHVVSPNKTSSNKVSSRLVWHDRLWEPVEVGGSKTWMSLRPSYNVRDLALTRASKDIIHQGFPLFTRAWFLQERLLSPRVVHFGHMELFWECRCKFWTQNSGPEPEEDPDSYDRSITSRNRDYHLAFMDESYASVARKAVKEKVEKRYPIEKARTVFTALINDTSTKESTPMMSQIDLDVPTAWNNLIEEYSRLKLTREMDRLPALSGVAAFRGPSTYLAGIWAESLPGSLFWTTDPSHDSLVRRPHYFRAPSFTWASIEGPIKYQRTLGGGRKEWETLIPERIGYWIADVKSFSSDVEGLDPHGRVKAGHVEIEGWTGTAKVNSLYQEGFMTVCELEQDSRVQKLYLDIPSCFCLTEPAEVRLGDAVLILLLECEKLPPAPLYSHIYRVLAIVLRPSILTIGAYERVGLICPTDDEMLYFMYQDSGGADVGKHTSMFDEAPRWFDKKEAIRIV
jgi:hypothetical protein